MAIGCPFPGCDYTVPENVNDQQLMNTCLNGHIQAIHPTSDTGSGVGAKSRLEKISRPTITTGCSQDDFEFFKSEKDDGVLRDDLIHCTDAGLRKLLHKTLGDGMKNTSRDDLLKVIQEVAVVKQS